MDTRRKADAHLFSQEEQLRISEREEKRKQNRARVANRRRQAQLRVSQELQSRRRDRRLPIVAIAVLSLLVVFSGIIASAPIG